MHMRSPLARVNGSGANKSYRDERKTIEAALNPAEGDWLYFLADKQGVTHFSKTYEQHVATCHRIYGAQTEC